MNVWLCICRHLVQNCHIFTFVKSIFISSTKSRDCTMSTKCILKCVINEELRYSTVSLFRNVHLLTFFYRKHELVQVRKYKISQLGILRYVSKIFFCDHFLSFLHVVQSFDRIKSKDFHRNDNISNYVLISVCF